MSDFKIPPISPLIGSNLVNYFRAIKSRKIVPKHYLKVFLTALVSGIASILMLWERIRESKNLKLKNPPIFILGHWRSGTTHLHNLLCQDPKSGFITTYQSIFPSNLYSKGLFKPFLKMVIPPTRPSDNVKLGVDLPQEDEFALENLIAPTFYNFFFFPDHFERAYDENIHFKNKDISKWENAYKKLIKKGEVNSNGNYMILKNPVNTGRVGRILEMYPEAFFIHIYRNPVIVYLSTKKFFISLIPDMQFQDTSEEDIIEIVFKLYANIMGDYLKNKVLIPSQQLIEIDFETFENNPINELEKIYKHFKIPNWNENQTYFKDYLNRLGSYKKNNYQITQKELDRIVKEWNFAFKEFKYDVPLNIKIIE
jgi:hypothetical protein